MPGCPMSILEKLMIAVVLSALAAGAYLTWESSIRRDERQQVNAKWEAEQLKVDKAWAIRLQKAQAQASNDLVKLRNQHAENLASIHLRLERTLGELRQRPLRVEATRIVSLPDQPAPVIACTGAELAREDGEFLAREAAGAAEQQERLVEAVGAYDACRATLRSVTGHGGGESKEGGTP